ncbi:MAG: hypothetical protein IKC59_00105, partial [Clostridia bacterium]|nr:hypothetical protein [Clostridia bacterium]
MKKAFLAGDFDIRPLECGGESPLEAFARAAKDAGAISLTVEIPDGVAPDRSMLAVREAYAGSVDVLFSAVYDLSAQTEVRFVPDIRVAALKTLCVDGKRYSLEPDREGLTALLACFDGSVHSMLRAVCKAFTPALGERYDVVILPDFEGWRAELDILWRADEGFVRQCMIELADRWIDAGAVFAMRMIPTPFCDGVMVSPDPSAIV